MKKHHPYATAPFAPNGLLFKTDFNIHLAHFYNPVGLLFQKSFEVRNNIVAISSVAVEVKLYSWLSVQLDFLVMIRQFGIRLEFKQLKLS